MRVNGKLCGVGGRTGLPETEKPKKISNLTEKLNKSTEFFKKIKQVSSNMSTQPLEESLVTLHSLII